MSYNYDAPIYEEIEPKRLAQNLTYESRYNKLDRKLNHNPTNEMMNNIVNLVDKKELPYDWIKLIEPITGKPYYACLTTKHTQWLNPTIPIGKMMPNGLPYGWEKEYDPKTKKYYYINHVGRFNTWNPPIKQRSYKGDNYTW